MMMTRRVGLRRIRGGECAWNVGMHVYDGWRFGRVKRGLHCLVVRPGLWVYIALVLMIEDVAALVVMSVFYIPQEHTSVSLNLSSDIASKRQHLYLGESDTSQS